MAKILIITLFVIILFGCEPQRFEYSYKCIQEEVIETVCSKGGGAVAGAIIGGILTGGVGAIVGGVVGDSIEDTRCHKEVTKKCIKYEDPKETKAWKEWNLKQKK